MSSCATTDCKPGLPFLSKANATGIGLIMGDIASHIATVSSTGFQWDLIFLEGPFADEMKNP